MKVAAIHHYTGLTIEALLALAKRDPDLVSYLPDEQDWVHLDKQWIADVLYTRDKEGVEELIEKA